MATLTAMRDTIHLFVHLASVTLARSYSVATNRTSPVTGAAKPEQSAPEVLEALVQQAERAEASDIHLHISGSSASVSFRLDGVMTPVAAWTAELAERVFGRIKFLSRLKTYQESLPQDGRIDKADLRARSDIRVATYPTVTGEKSCCACSTPRPSARWLTWISPLSPAPSWNIFWRRPRACCC